MPTGRFAPSPTGLLHIGNLRTALVAWLFARSSGGQFLVRMEDLDRAVARPEHEAAQLDDLRSLGLDWDGEVVRQSERTDLYHAAIDRLDAAGLVYPCYCTRREIHEAAGAPNGPPTPEGAYPGTCRVLSAAQRSRHERGGRRPALRLRADGRVVAFADRLCGEAGAQVDDVVLRRNDGTVAYNLAVVVDDAAQAVEEVVRGDDLLLSTPRHIELGRLLGLPRLSYAHISLVLGPEGQRLAKRDGAVTLTDRAKAGQAPPEVLSWIAASLGLCESGEPVSPTELLARFDPARLPRAPWQLTLLDLA